MSQGFLREGVQFQIRLRGYDCAQVDDFLDRVADEFEALQVRVLDAAERVERAERAATEGVETSRALRQTLALAQQAADGATKDAVARATRIIEEAQAMAAGLLAQAEHDLRADIARLEQIRSQMATDVDSLTARADVDMASPSHHDNGSSDILLTAAVRSLHGRAAQGQHRRVAPRSS